MNNTNHTRPLSDFQEALDKVTSAGFKPIAVTQMYFEDTFVFERPEEAQEAYDTLEREGKVTQAWWYGKEDFLKAVKEYESHEDIGKVLIHWLK